MIKLNAVVDNICICFRVEGLFLFKLSSIDFDGLKSKLTAGAVEITSTKKRRSFWDSIFTSGK